MSSLIFILGGARSGKSAYALDLAHQMIGDEPLLFIATAQAGDGEMAERIARHQAERPTHWQTLEAPLAVGRCWQKFQESQHNTPPHRVVILDCLTLLISNLLFAGDSNPEHESEDDIQRRVDKEIDELLLVQANMNATLIVVSNEVGLGIVPAGRISRLYRDLLGRANRRMVAAAHHAHFLLAGIPIDLKAGHAPPIGEIRGIAPSVIQTRGADVQP